MKLIFISQNTESQMVFEKAENGVFVIHPENEMKSEKRLHFWNYNL